MRQSIVCWVLLFSVGLLSGCRTSETSHLPHLQNQSQSLGKPVHSAKQPIVEAKPQWFSCESHSECSVEPGPCGTVEAVNTQFLEPFRTYREQLNPSLECHNTAPPSPQSKAVCIQHRCNVQETP